MFVDISNYLEVKVDSLGAHASQMSSDREVRLERVTRNSSRHKESTGLDYAGKDSAASPSHWHLRMAIAP
ncbi:MAG: hypothetical protein Ct9H300mP11_15660 [Chloroflexota bacterium]|nr:MAG: hypothetical protein Ct9H300mP11_15660 [Chloroflexota bacterium]